MIRCPYCPQTFTYQAELDRHISQFHAQQPGWFERQQTILNPDSGKTELKALQHQLAQLKNQPNPQPLPTPIISPPQKQGIKPMNGWVKAGDGFSYEKEIYRRHTPLESEMGILKARLTSNHGSALLHHYRKDLSEISHLQEKENILQGRLNGHVPGDPAFLEIVQELHKTKMKISDLTKNNRADETHEVVADIYWHREPMTEEHVKWSEDFMSQIITEAERIASNSNKKE